ncbi:MAG TPA: DUF1501 domain-containing protein [Devosia sp.]|jgi:uncharacterized protein (DUF1501 family)|nr:DUF1501 domain-containing protein [Devosia sp.]HEV2518782.1 DUF1501 domain-containing protein [Devosia sp.]
MTMKTPPSIADALLCPSRRVFLAGAGAFVAWANLPRPAYAAPGREPRFIAVILRGAMDGLAVVPPIGDKDYAGLRGDLAIGAVGQEPALPLDGFFGLNSAMPGFHALYQKGEALIVHASATPYRDRSHFDGQDVLESGLGGPGLAPSGWLNRAAASIPAGEGVRPVSGLAASPTIPLILRGDAPTLSWTPPRLETASADTLKRLLDLYTHEAPEMARVLGEGVDLDALAAGIDVNAGGGLAASFKSLAQGSARLLAEDGGPRLAALSYDGWDTHTAEDGRLDNVLGALDGALQSLATELAPVWQDTVIAVMTEFGRTARANGNEGTDHGTATVAFLLGGAVKGGRVIADWPGLAETDLYEDRDLKPTTDLRAVLKGVLRDHLGIAGSDLSTKVFPDSIGVMPMDGLVA